MTNMKKWNLLVDVALCENCNNCALAVKDEHIGNDFPGYAAPQPKHGHHWIDIKRNVRGSDPMVDVAYRPTTCNHCDAAPCVAAAHGEAIYKRPDGIVIIDPQKAKGRRDLVNSCPYDAIWWNEELQLPQKWIFDAQLIDQGWKKPRCVQVCPTGALRSFFVEDEEMQEKVRREKLETLRPELGTKPRVYYRNLYRYSKCFIGGSVIVTRDGVVDCLADARVGLLSGSQQVAETKTDNFGDFKFDGLEPSSGTYRVEVSHPEFGVARLESVLYEQSNYLGEILLGRDVAPGTLTQSPTGDI
jgi:Fe-S-cluster-containing dehydrogenase component